MPWAEYRSPFGALIERDVRSPKLRQDVAGGAIDLVPVGLR